MKFVLMMLLCGPAAHCKHANECKYVHYHEMRYNTMAECLTAQNFIASVKKPATAPGLMCKREDES